MLGPGNGNIHPPLISDKSNISPVIVSHTVEDNDVSFLALEGIHCVDMVIKLRKKLFQQVYLSLVWRDDPDAQRLCGGRFQGLDQFFSLKSLSFVQS